MELQYDLTKPMNTTIVYAQERSYGENVAVNDKRGKALTKLRDGTLSVHELCSKVHQRMQKTKVLNMYIKGISHEEMLKRIQESQNRIDKGTARPLESMLIGFKDNFCTTDMPTTCASRSLHAHTPSYNSTLVQRCLDSGAILIGKHNMDEFAMGIGGHSSCHGPAVNPWILTVDALPCKSDASSNLTIGDYDLMAGNKDYYITGGSSGGSAAAVAAGTCMAAFGSDTGGSVRQPACYCGVIGLKPTYGLLSRHGLVPLISSTDCPGIFSKTVEDCVIILNAVAGPDPRDPVTHDNKPIHIEIDPKFKPTGIHIGIPKEYRIQGMSEEILALWQDMADVLEKAGAKVSQVSLPHTEDANQCYRVLCRCEVASTFSRFDKDKLGLIQDAEEPRHRPISNTLDGSWQLDLDFNQEVKDRMQWGKYYLQEGNYEKYYLKAQSARQQISADYQKVFDDGVDMLLTPVNGNDAPLKSWFRIDKNQEYLASMYPLLIPANLAGLPAISIPLGLSKKGLPLGLQLIGQSFGEQKLLSVAHWLEKTADFPRLSLDFLDDEEDTTG